MNRREILGRILATSAALVAVALPKLPTTGEDDYSWIIRDNMCKHCGWIQEMPLVGDSRIRLTEHHATAWRQYPGCRREAMNGRESVMKV